MSSQLLIQIFAFLFAMFALSRVYLRFKEKKLSSVAFLLWSLIWLTGTVIVIFPELTSKVANFFGIGRGADVILYASIIVLYYLIFRIYILIDDTQKQITQIAKKVALDKYYKNSSKNSSK